MKRKNAMKHWKNGPLKNWVAYEKGKYVTFEASGPRRIKFEVMSIGKFEITASYDGGQNETLVAVGADEKIYVETVIERTVDMIIKTEAKGTAYLNIPDLDQSVQGKYADENFVNLEPRTAQNPELVRMQNMFKSTVAAMQQQVAQQKRIIDSMSKNNTEEPVVEPVATEEAETTDAEGDSAAS
jgi:hypothetical protein